MDKWQQSQQASDKDDFSLLHVARFILGGMALIYMFGQLFFGSFSIVTTSVAISGFVIAFNSKKQIIENRSTQLMVLACCILGMTGITYDIYEYYSNYQHPGNYYPLPMSIGFIVAFLVAGFYSIKYRNS